MDTEGERQLVITTKLLRDKPKAALSKEDLLVLERIGSPDALRLLTHLVKGAENAPQTAEARKSLEHVAAQKASQEP
jgi:hypothetical protein